MAVALLDLKPQYARLREEIRSRLDEVMDEQTFILGKRVEELERAIADYTGTKHAIGVASGTDALLLPLKALDLQPGDEVVTTPFTFFATAGAIHNAGARAVFVDIQPETFNIDPSGIAAAVGKRTRSIVPVHLFGQMARVEAVREYRERGIQVLEDAAQALGSRRRIDGEWRAPGVVGTCAALSFFPSKNLGGFGDGGMVVTDDEELAARVRRLRVHGGLKMYHHEEVGTNSRLDALQAAVLLTKLPHLDGWAEGRRRNAAWYHERFAPLEERGVVRRPVIDDCNEHVFNQYTLRVERRDSLREHLNGQKIGNSVYYPLPLHLQECFSYLGYGEGDFPESERAAREVLSIPVYPDLSESELDEVASAIEEFYG